MSLKKIFGRRAVMEALRSQDIQVEKVMLAKGVHGTIVQEVESAAETRGVELEWLERRRLEKMAGPVVHQGVMAIIKGRDYLDATELIQAAAEEGPQALVVVCDELEDPRNVGAIARCAEGAGAQGMIITAHRSAEVTAVSDKASGGAITHLPIARVVNLANTLRDAKAAGLWVVGLDAVEGQSIWEADLKRPMLLVIGNEGKGLRRLTKEICDMLIKIPMQGKVGSLNASVATGIALFETVRQRLGSPPRSLSN